MISKKDYKYFNHAREASKLSDFPRVNVGCIVVYKNKVIAIGYNMDKSHPIQRKYNKFRDYNLSGGKCPKESLHAEMYCILQIIDLDIDFSKVKIYVYRNKKDGSLGMSRPCQACAHAIRDLGIKNIYYTTDYGYAYENYENVLN